MRRNIEQVVVTLVIVAAFVIYMLYFNSCRPKHANTVSITRDTILRVDTVYARVPVPTKIVITRYDTVRLKIKPVDERSVVMSLTHDSTTVDTSKATASQSVEVIIPIESKEYKTEDYRAIVSGYRCTLDSMQLYQKTMTIKETITRVNRPRWAMTAGVGLGYYDKKIAPYVGLSFGYVLFSR